MGIRPSEASIAGKHYVIANGGKVRNLGEQRVVFKNAEGDRGR